MIPIIILLLMMVPALGENVSLFWDANTEPDVLSYNVKRGDAAGGPYTTIDNVGQTSNPFYTDIAVDLTADKFYVVTAVNSSSLESSNSNEVSASAIPPGVPPDAPTITITVTVSP